MFFVWVGYLANLGYSMQEALYINIDETPIPYHFGGKKGLKQKRNMASIKDDMRDRANTRDVRQHCTLMAAICNDPKIQEQLPQVLMPNIKGRAKKWKAARLKSSEYPNVRILTNTGGWITIKSLLVYLEILKEMLHKLGVNKIVLVMDCHSTHRSVKVLRKLRKMKWKVLFVPGKLTYLLQPLDAWFFASFKQSLYKMNTKARIASTSGEESFETWAEVCFSTIQACFANTSTTHMFHKCGFEIPNSTINETIMHHLPESALGMTRKLTMDELADVMGACTHLQYRLLFHEDIPEENRNHHIVVRKPLLRMRSKTNVMHTP